MSKVPDKIYVDIIDDEILLMSPSISDNGGEVYIRKDALLDWVKLVYGKVSMNPFDCSEAFEELINKIDAL